MTQNQINDGPDYYVCGLVLRVKAYLLLLVRPYLQEQFENVLYALFDQTSTRAGGVGCLHAFPPFERANTYWKRYWRISSSTWLGSVWKIVFYLYSPCKEFNKAMPSGETTAAWPGLAFLKRVGTLRLASSESGLCRTKLSTYYYIRTKWLNHKNFLENVWWTPNGNGCIHLIKRKKYIK